MGAVTQSVAILVVDDELVVREFVSRALQSRGYRVHVAEGGVEALADFKKTPDLFQLVISDISMPRMNGIQLAGELKELRPDLPILFISGDHFRWQPHVGSDPIIPKPFSIQALFEEVEFLLKSTCSFPGNVR